MRAPESKELIRRLFAAMDAVARGDDVRAELDALCARGFQIHMPGAPVMDQEGFFAFLHSFAAGFPRYVHEIEEQVAEGDRVATRVTWQGTHAGEFQGIPATGRTVVMSALNLDRIENEQIVEHRVIFDVMGMLQQLGVIPTPETATA